MRRATVICAYTADRWKLLERAVDSVEHQDVPSELTIVIDHNDALLARARARWPAHQVLANCYERGLSGARNTGVAATAGADAVAFLDDDAQAQPGWLRALTAPFDEVGQFVDGIGRIGRVPLGCEETEFPIRAGRNGYRVRYEPGSAVLHHVPTSRATVEYFLRRCYAEGLSKAVVARSVGSTVALESERTYVSRTLPRGVARSVSEGALGRAAMIVAGCATAGLGYMVGRASPRRQHARTHDGDRVGASEAAA